MSYTAIEEATMADKKFGTNSNHRISERNTASQHDQMDKGDQHAYEAGVAPSRQLEEQGSIGAPTALAPHATASSRSARTAQNYDEAPPGQPGPDFSARKPVFTRGPSVMDYTAVTSAAPTPAGEIANPLGTSMPQGGSRQRESHLPDLELLESERNSSGVSRLQPKDEISGTDGYGSELSRAEVENGSGGTTDNWRG